MTAVAEARALLDSLMGADRDAPLPEGMALPRNKHGATGDLMLPGKRHKSCYDRDICPLYCAWGVDVYELFVNTKSDIGPNPYTPDDGARKEYQSLPPQEKERLGFDHFLFVKLQELVQQCDRTVQRNHEKLNKELQRQLQKRGNMDYVHDVDEAAVDEYCRSSVMLEELLKDVEGALSQLDELRPKEEELKAKIEEATKQRQEKEADGQGSKEGDEGKGDAEESKDDTKLSQGTGTQASKPVEPPPESLELGKLLLKKQAILCDIAFKMGELGPLQDSVDNQLRNMEYVKSDTTTDKTVCEVSGNFMSARDADERIAAHYAGKQYVGWKLVRDKFKEMLSKYGKYGPPRPGPPQGGPPGPPPPMRGPPGGRDNGGHFRRDSGSSGRFSDGGHSRGGGGGYRDRDRGPSRDSGRWERSGGGGYGSRGGYDDRGGYDRGRRDGGHRGGGGGWGRR